MQHSPERSALGSLALLESLSRKQLITLAKKFDLKANGKNAELITRLYEHGQQLDQRVSHDSLNPDEGDTSAYSLMDEDAVEGAAGADEFGASTSTNSMNTASSSNSLSTLRGASGSVLRRTSSPRHSLRDAFTAADANSPHQQLAINTDATSLASPNHVALIYPSLTSPSLSGSPSSYAFTSTGGNSPVGIRAVPTPDRRATMSLSVQSDNGDEGEDVEMSLDDVPSSPEEMREVPRGTTLVARLTAPSTPPQTSLAPPSSTFVFGSPDARRAPFTFGAAFNPATDSVAPLKSADESAEDGRTAAERIMAEVRARVTQERIASGGTADRPLRTMEGLYEAGTPSGLRRSESQKSLAKGEQFEGKHKRVFDKMDSIASHYAAKRPASAAGPLNSTSLSRSKSTASLNASASTSAAPLASSSNADRPAKRSKLASSTASLADKKLAAGLRRSGFASIPSKPRTLPGVVPKKTGDLSAVRPGLIADADKVAAQRKRQLELARARRKSGAAGVGLTPGRKERRRSTQVGPLPKLNSSLNASQKGNAATRLFRAAFGKTDKKTPAPAAATAPAPVASATESAATKPGLTKLPTSKSSFALPTATSQAKTRVGSTAPSVVGSMSSRMGEGRVPKKEPKKKFDLQESLKRPLSYIPKIGAKASSSTLPTTSTLPRSSSISRKLSSAPSITNLASSVSSISPALKRPTMRATGPSLSGRVANSSLLSPIRPDEEGDIHQPRIPLAALPVTPVPVIDENDEPTMSGAFPSSASSVAVNALSDAPEALAGGKAGFCFATSSVSKPKPALAKLALNQAHLKEGAELDSLGSPIHGTFSPVEPRAPLQPNNFLPPTSPEAGAALGTKAAPATAAMKKKGATAPAKGGATPRKMVSAASRGLRDGNGKKGAREEFESKARRVVVSRAKAKA